MSLENNTTDDTNNNANDNDNSDYNDTIRLTIYNYIGSFLTNESKMSSFEQEHEESTLKEIIPQEQQCRTLGSQVTQIRG